MINVYMRLAPKPGQKLDVLILSLEDGNCLDELQILVESIRPVVLRASYVGAPFWQYIGSYR